MLNYGDYLSHIDLAEILDKSNIMLKMRKDKRKSYDGYASMETKICINAYKLLGLNLKDWNPNYTTLISLMLGGTYYFDFRDTLSEQAYKHILNNEKIIKMMLLGIPGNIAIEVYNKPELRRLFIKEYAKDKRVLELIYKYAKKSSEVDNEKLYNLQDLLSDMSIPHIKLSNSALHYLEKGYTYEYLLKREEE